jgi:methylase of polypeptide subunit release factors
VGVCSEGLGFCGKKKQLPTLHNTQIFRYDFFDDSSPLYQQQRRFDWIIGNPPWIQAEEAEKP